MITDCLEAVIRTNEDGSISCPLLETGDTCEDCYRALEWKQLKKESGWTSKEFVCYATRPDRPRYIDSVFKVLNKDGNHIGYECNFCFHKSLGFIEAAGWTLDKQEEAMATYYTKCGNKFDKTTNAVTTGHDVPFTEDFVPKTEVIGRSLFHKNCPTCPFKIKVTEGYPNLTFKRWECRAGSKPPNHTNEWSGSLEDKNHIHIMSLDNDFMESIIEYCEADPDLSAYYNATDEADCRRVVSIGCSPNKAGMAAKKALVEKFFTEEVKMDEFAQAKEANEQLKKMIVGIDLANGPDMTAINGKIVRPLEIIETEINFYKQQTGIGFLEIGKRLIEAKAQIPHGEWGKWLDEKAEFSQEMARRFMRVAEEYSNSNPGRNLGFKKMWLLLDVPAEERESFIKETPVEDMTTRQLQEEIRKRKQAEEKAAELAEHIEKTNRYADEHMRRARDAEFKLENKEIVINSLRVDLEHTKSKGVEKIVEKVVEKIPEDYETVKKAAKTLESKLAITDEEVKRLKQQLKDAEAYRDTYKESLETFKHGTKNFDYFSIDSFQAMIKKFMDEAGKYVYLAEEYEKSPQQIKNKILTGTDLIEKWVFDMRQAVSGKDLGANVVIINSRREEE